LAVQEFVHEPGHGMHQNKVDLQQQLSPPVLTKSPTRSYARSRGSGRLPPPFFRGSRPEPRAATGSSDAAPLTSGTAPSDVAAAAASDVAAAAASDVAATPASDAVETAAEFAAEFEAPALPGTPYVYEAEEIDGLDELSDAPEEPTGFEAPPGFERDIAVVWAPASEWYHDASTGDIAAAESDMPAGGEDGPATAAEVNAGAAWEPYRIADPEPSAFSVDQPDASLWALEFGAPAREAQQDLEQDSEDQQHSEVEQESGYEHVAEADVVDGGVPEVTGFSEDAEVDPERPAPDQGHELAWRVATQLDELADELREMGMAALARRSDTGELARLIAAVIAGFRSREQE
jgi:hypothetical protein